MVVPHLQPPVGRCLAPFPLALHPSLALSFIPSPLQRYPCFSHLCAVHQSLAFTGLSLLLPLAASPTFTPAKLQHFPCSSHLQPKLGYDPDGSGYHFKRHDFDPEWDNDAECIIADMEFTDADTEEDRRQKLRMLEIYNKCVWEVWGSSGECGARVFGSRAVAGIHGVKMALTAGAEGAGGRSCACSTCVQVCGAVWAAGRGRGSGCGNGSDSAKTGCRSYGCWKATAGVWPPPCHCNMVTLIMSARAPNVHRAALRVLIILSSHPHLAPCFYALG